MGAATELGLRVGIAVACAALGIARASFYRARRGWAKKSCGQPHPPRPGTCAGGRRARGGNRAFAPGTICGSQRARGLRRAAR